MEIPYFQTAVISSNLIYAVCDAKYQNNEHYLSYYVPETPPIGNILLIACVEWMNL